MFMYLVTAFSLAEFTVESVMTAFFLAPITYLVTAFPLSQT